MKGNEMGPVNFSNRTWSKEEAHIDWLEAQIDQISQMGIENYLTNQTQ